MLPVIELRRANVRAFHEQGMNTQQRDRGVELIMNPPLGSKLAAAKEFGIDLTLLLENLALTPTERLQKLWAAGVFYEELRQAGQRYQMR